MIDLVQDLLGVPYKVGARLPGQAVDCYGLVVECCRRLGRPIPDPYLSAEQPMDAKAWVIERLGGWVPTDRPVPGGIVELRSAEQVAHVGFLLNETQFLHSMSTTGVVVGRLDREPWRGRVVGLYEYAG